MMTAHQLIALLENSGVIWICHADLLTTRLRPGRGIVLQVMVWTATGRTFVLGDGQRGERKWWWWTRRKIAHAAQARYAREVT